MAVLINEYCCCYYLAMVDSVQTRNAGYPDVWVRWVTQQVRVAVTFEMSTANPAGWPHLRRLPLALDAAGVDDEKFLRELIARAAHRAAGDVDNRIDTVVMAVLADEAVTVAEPDLQTMLAWRLAERHTMKSLADDNIADYDDSGDHECLDPEAVAADLIASGLVAPAWKSSELSALAAHNHRLQTGTPSPRRRRPAVSPLQMAFFL